MVIVVRRNNEYFFGLIYDTLMAYDNVTVKISWDIEHEGKNKVIVI